MGHLQIEGRKEVDDYDPLSLSSLFSTQKTLENSPKWFRLRPVLWSTLGLVSPRAARKTGKKKRLKKLLYRYNNVQ